MFSWIRKHAAISVVSLIVFSARWFAKILFSLWDLQAKIEGSPPITYYRASLIHLQRLEFYVEDATPVGEPICLTIQWFFNGRDANG